MRMLAVKREECLEETGKKKWRKKLVKLEGNVELLEVAIM